MQILLQLNLISNILHYNQCFVCLCACLLVCMFVCMFICLFACFFFAQSLSLLMLLHDEQFKNDSEQIINKYILLKLSTCLCLPQVTNARLLSGIDSEKCFTIFLDHIVPLSEIFSEVQVTICFFSRFFVVFCRYQCQLDLDDSQFF